MSVRMRHTRGHTNNRRSHHALSETKAIKDAKTGKLRLPHRVDELTGTYRGKQIVQVKAKKVSTKAKGPAASVETHPVHDHVHEHANAEVKNDKGMIGKITGRAKARSGTGGEK